MGATLGHLYVVEYDLITMKQIGYHLSIDYALADPIEKANKECPVINKNPIVRTIYIPLVMEKVYAEYWEMGIKTDKIVDVNNISVYPIHKVYGGSSMGFGSDPVLEKNLEENPGYFIFNDVIYHLKDFKCDEEQNEDKQDHVNDLNIEGRVKSEQDVNHVNDFNIEEQDHKSIVLENLIEELDLETTLVLLDKTKKIAHSQEDTIRKIFFNK